MRAGHDEGRKRAGPKDAVRFLSRAVRSGLRRYPTQLAGSLRQEQGIVFPDRSFAQRWDEALASDRREGGRSIVLSWLGHCTVLMRLDELTLLTDPVLSDRIGVRVASRTIGVERLSPAPVRAEDLPPIDVILLSHPHFDHLDRPTLERLRSPTTLVVTATNTRRLVPRGFGDVVELGWHRRASLQGLEVESLRPRHWGARAVWDRHRGYNSYVLRRGGRCVLFAGDTAKTEAFDALRGIDLAIFGIGAYEPWEHAHATPEQVWAMARGCGCRRVLPVHHSTFELGDEAPGEPLRRLRRAAEEEEGPEIVEIGPGDVVRVPA